MRVRNFSRYFGVIIVLKYHDVTYNINEYEAIRKATVCIRNQ